jgi:hypothetical protein
MILYAVAPRPLYDGHRRIQDSEYLEFVRSQGVCIVRFCRRRMIEAAHIGPRGRGTKADDDQAVNICHFHHQAAPKSLHNLGRVAFSKLHRINFDEIISHLQEEYEQTKRQISV